MANDKAKPSAAGNEPNLYELVRDQLIEEIKTGRKYPEGALLPSVREITVQWTVSTTTARKVLSELVQAGYARSEGTRGHVSLGPTPAAPASPSGAVDTPNTGSGLTVRTPQVVTVHGIVEPATTAIDVRSEPGPAEVALALRLDSPATPLVVRRTLAVDTHGTPIQLRTSYTVMEIAKGTPLEDAQAIDAPWLEALAEHSGRRTRLAASDISARHPSDSEAAMLALAPTACVLARIDVTQDNDRPIDYTVTIWPGESTRIAALHTRERQ